MTGQSRKIVAEIGRTQGNVRTDDVVRSMSGTDQGNRYEGMLSPARMPYLAPADKIPSPMKLTFRHDSMVGGMEK